MKPRRITSTPRQKNVIVMIVTDYRFIVTGKPHQKNDSKKSNSWTTHCKRQQKCYQTNILTLLLLRSFEGGNTSHIRVLLICQNKQIPKKSKRQGKSSNQVCGRGVRASADVCIPVEISPPHQQQIRESDG